MIYLKTQKHGVTDYSSQLSLCISRDRLFQISIAMSNRAIKLYSEEGAIVPTNLKKDLFTTAVADSIDVNSKVFNSFDVSS